MGADGHTEADSGSLWCMTFSNVHLGDVAKEEVDR